MKTAHREALSCRAGDKSACVYQVAGNARNQAALIHLQQARVGQIVTPALAADVQEIFPLRSADQNLNEVIE